MLNIVLLLKRKMLVSHCIMYTHLSMYSVTRSFSHFLTHSMWLLGLDKKSWNLIWGPCYWWLTMTNPKIVRSRPNGRGYRLKLVRISLHQNANTCNCYTCKWCFYIRKWIIIISDVCSCWCSYRACTRLHPHWLYRAWCVLTTQLCWQ